MKGIVKTLPVTSGDETKKGRLSTNLKNLPARDTASKRGNNVIALVFRIRGHLVAPAPGGLN